MLLKDFEIECNEWLNPLGWTVYMKTNTSIIYNNIESPISITCFIDAGNNKRIQLIDYLSYELGLNLNSGYIQFKHPDIKKYISVMEHYGSLAEKNKPW